MPRRRWKPRPPQAPAAAAAEPTGLRPDLARRAPCALCGREARGFGYVHKLLWGRYPHQRFCSKPCLDSGSGHAARNKGMIDKSDMERIAIRHARTRLAETLTTLGLMGAFFSRSAAEIDLLIESCVDGFQEGMQRQAPPRDPFEDAEIPF
jgi:hypothetical protein